MRLIPSDSFNNLYFLGKFNFLFNNLIKCTSLGLSSTVNDGNFVDKNKRLGCFDPKKLRNANFDMVHIAVT